MSAPRCHSVPNVKRAYGAYILSYPFASSPPLFDSFPSSSISSKCARLRLLPLTSLSPTSISSLFTQRCACVHALGRNPLIYMRFFSFRKEK